MNMKYRIEKDSNGMYHASVNFGGNDDWARAGRGNGFYFRWTAKQEAYLMMQRHSDLMARYNRVVVEEGDYEG